MGVVYRAVDVRLDRTVALKVLAARAVADPERRAWWTSKREVAEEFLAGGSDQPAAGSAPRPEEKITDATKIVGRATYKGKSGYLILWMGTTRHGEAVKLAFRDGSKIF